eukprot:Hpha_TRINITY_DN2829_c0_g1::TRINITY_DN2829_c0_g1_i1::g.171511::m.171511
MSKRPDTRGSGRAGKPAPKGRGPLLTKGLGSDDTGSLKSPKSPSGSAGLPPKKLAPLGGASKGNTPSAEYETFCGDPMPNADSDAIGSLDRARSNQKKGDSGVPLLSPTADALSASAFSSPQRRMSDLSRGRGAGGSAQGGVLQRRGSNRNIVTSEEGDDDDPFRSTLAPCSPMGQLQRVGTSVHARNTVDNIDDVRVRRASMMMIRQEEMEQKAKEAEEKREQAKIDKFERPKREHLAQRTLLWIQVLCAITVPSSVTQGAAETRAKALLAMLWLPMVQRYRRLRRQRQAKADYIKSCENEMQELRLEPKDLQKIEFFEDWRPYNLEKLIEAMQPDAFREGEYIMMEGDWGMEMYVIAKGKIDIAIRKAAGPGGVKGKSRSRKDGIVVASLNENSGKRYFGEFSVLCHEPRTASVVAATDIMLWRIGKKDIDEQLDLLPSTVREKVLRAADNRRTQNMAKLFPLRGEKLTKAPEGACPLFQCYAVPPTQLQDIVNLFEPRVVRANTVLFEQGDPGDLFYFIASGEVTIRKKKVNLGQSPGPSASSPKRVPSSAGKEGVSPREERRESAGFGGEEVVDDPYETVAVLGQGHSFGEVALIFLENRTARAVATQTSDLWVLKKDDLLMFLMSMPDWFVEAKRTMSAVRASWLPPLQSDLWGKDPTLQKLFGSKFFKEITGASEPRVIDRSMDLVASGADVEHLYIVVEGSVRVLRTNEVIKAPCVFGVPDVLTFQPRWFTSYKAERRCDMFALSKRDFWAAVRRHHAEALQRVMTKEFQDTLSEEFNMPFQPWDDKLAEHARVAAGRRSVAADDRGSGKGQSGRIASPASPKQRPSAQQKPQRVTSPRAGLSDPRAGGQPPKTPDGKKRPAAGGVGRGVSAARGNA